MDIPRRKPNRLSDYDYSTNGAYFITICVKDRKPILGTITVGDGAHDVPFGAYDAPMVALTKIGEIAHKYILGGNRIPGISVDKYVIMPDHIHLIVLVDNIEGGTSRAPSPTNEAIPHFVSTFKRLCHREAGTAIFQRSYYDHVIRNQRDYDEIWQYIENNPRKWVIQKRGYE